MSVHVAEGYQLADIGAIGMADLFLSSRAVGVLAEALREHTQLNSCIAVVLLGSECTGGWADSHLIEQLAAQFQGLGEPGHAHRLPIIQKE